MDWGLFFKDILKATLKGAGFSVGGLLLVILLNRALEKIFPAKKREG